MADLLMNELLINNKDAYTTWGVRMGEGFLDVIGAGKKERKIGRAHV